VVSGLRTRKRLGQHFLKDRSFAIRLVESMGIQPGDRILEIGSGEGVLTELLLKSSASQIYGVEIDSRLCQFLTERFRGEMKFHLIEKDFLKFDISSICERKHELRVAGNLPYYITSPILFHLLENRSCIRDSVVTVQKEVGERMASPPNQKSYGVPSVLFQTYCDVKVLFRIPRQVFFPVPEVDSVVMQIEFERQRKYSIKNEDLYERIVKGTFNQRRKMLRNTLARLIDNASILNEIAIDLSRRPESLSVPEFVALGNEVSEQLKRGSLGGEKTAKK
jgi:16S rRNA (adenine1518-N6/adenine1519-N6)-dimethyltransferase